MTHNLRVSVISTFKDEEATIREFLDSLLAQSRPPDEIVITDGGSTDGTVEIVQEYIQRGVPARLLVIPGANRSVGRNAAIRVAKYDIIACTDVGCKLDKEWLKNIVKPFMTDPETMVVAGFFEVLPQSLFEECVGALTGFPPEGTDPAVWLPSSRSIAYRKEAWKKVGGYPEQFSFNEDTPFDISLRRAGFKFTNAEDALVYWRPRSTLWAFFKQYHAYARGDGQALINVAGYGLRTAIYVGGAIMLVWGIFFRSLWIVLLVGTVFYLLRRLVRAWRRLPKWPVLFIIPVLVIVNDLADISGYLRGVIERFVTGGEWS